MFRSYHSRWEWDNLLSSRVIIRHNPFRSIESVIPLVIFSGNPSSLSLILPSRDQDNHRPVGDYHRREIRRWLQSTVIGGMTLSMGRNGLRSMIPGNIIHDYLIRWSLSLVTTAWLSSSLSRKMTQVGWILSSWWSGRTNIEMVRLWSDEYRVPSSPDLPRWSGYVITDRLPSSPRQDGMVKSEELWSTTFLRRRLSSLVLISEYLSGNDMRYSLFEYRSSGRLRW